VTDYVIHDKCMTSAVVVLGRREPMAIDEKALWDSLREVYDPEIPVNVVDLGLIYRLEVKEGNLVEVDMTMTAPACPMAPQIIAEAKDKLLGVAGVEKVHINLVWQPLWNPEMMSDTAKDELGYTGY
jgi:metal-sulfur cluster biosynthetic enzyme